MAISRQITLIAASLCVLSLSQQSHAASIRSWGSSAADSSQFGRNDNVAVSAGWYHSLALKTAGSIVAWGANNYHQATPPEGDDFLAISAGGGHSLALKRDGSIVAWGANDYRQATPPEGDDFLAISAGWNHSLALQRVCRHVLAGDLNDDCEVDFDDFALMGANWLLDCYAEPPDPACTPK